MMTFSKTELIEMKTSDFDREVFFMLFLGVLRHEFNFLPVNQRREWEIGAIISTPAKHYVYMKPISNRNALIQFEIDGWLIIKIFSNEKRDEAAAYTDMFLKTSFTYEELTNAVKNFIKRFISDGEIYSITGFQHLQPIESTS